MEKIVIGNPKQDLRNLRKSNRKFLIDVISYYVPSNTKLINYIHSSKATNAYLYKQAKTILDARINK